MDYTLCPENCQHFHPVRKIALLKDCKIRIDDNDDNVNSTRSGKMARIKLRIASLSSSILSFEFGPVRLLPFLKLENLARWEEIFDE